MLFAHEQNIKTKINSNYHGKGEVLKKFYEEEYIPMRKRIIALNFNEENIEAFETATREFNSYYNKLEEFSKKNKISSQSKLNSSFLEEISSYLFKDIAEIKNGTLGIYNKGIYAGLKLDNHRHISIIKKDVDFCIGKKVKIRIEGQDSVELIVPIIAVEVKTYLDATMFGEVKSSSKAIRSATPSSKAYVLMGYRNIADYHIVAARQDSTLTEMFSLRKGENKPILSEVIFEYWKEIKDALNPNVQDELDFNRTVNKSGRLLDRKF